LDPFLYLDRNTVIHRLDPRTKILMLLAGFIVALLFMHPLWGGVVILIVLLVAAYAKCLSNLRRIWYALFVLTTMGTVLWSLMSKGPTPFIGPVKWEAFLFGLGSAIRIDATIIVGMIFLSTTRNEEIVMGMVRLGVPYRFGFAFSTALRLVPTVIGTLATITQAQRSRGLDLDAGNAFQRFKKSVPLVIPAFLTTIRNTNVFGMALDSKGFGARPNRTNYLRVHFGKADVISLGLTLVVVAVGVALWAMHYGRIPGLVKF
jgi:energy-coupling factor transport system permease protein